MDTAGKRATFVWWEYELVPHHTNVCKIPRLCVAILR